MIVDPNVVAAARAGDHDAFAALVRAHLPQTFRMCLLILRSPTEADDATQEAFFRAWRELPKLRDTSAWPAWFRRLTIRAAIDHQRRTRRRARVPAMERDTNTQDASTVSSERDQASRLLARLRPEDRALVVLRYYVDLELPAAAEALGIPLGTAKSRLSRALARMRSELEPTRE